MQHGSNISDENNDSKTTLRLRPASCCCYWVTVFAELRYSGKCMFLLDTTEAVVCRYVLYDVNTYLVTLALGVAVWVLGVGRWAVYLSTRVYWVMLLTLHRPAVCLDQDSLARSLLRIVLLPERQLSSLKCLILIQICFWRWLHPLLWISSAVHSCTPQSVFLCELCSELEWWAVTAATMEQEQQH
jgi:hypothetical protein